MPSTGFIAHCIPSHDIWLPSTFSRDVEVLFAYTRSYSPQHQIINDNYNTTATSYFIAYSYIYYNPHFTTLYGEDNCADCTAFQTWEDVLLGKPNSWAVIVAHEIGHVLGFGHNSDDSSLMYDLVGEESVHGLSEDDLAEFRTKYG